MFAFGLSGYTFGKLGHTCKMENITHENNLQAKLEDNRIETSNGEKRPKTVKTSNSVKLTAVTRKIHL